MGGGYGWLLEKAGDEEGGSQVSGPLGGRNHNGLGSKSAHDCWTNMENYTKLRTLSLCSARKPGRRKREGECGQSSAIRDRNAGLFQLDS